MRDALFDAYSDICHFASPESAEGPIEVAVIDSVYSPEDVDAEFDVRRTVDEVNSEGNLTTGHSLKVANIIDNLSGTVEFSFYRVVRQRNDSTVVLDRDLLAAIGKAHTVHDVDVINLSVGNDHAAKTRFDCTVHHQTCEVTEFAQKAIDDGIPVVAGAGNRGLNESICCPGALDEVICVGGVTIKCTARLPSDNPLSLRGKHTKPPRACWVERPDDVGTDEVLCGGEFCFPGEGCEQNRGVEFWDGNVPSVNNKPDVLAPAHYPIKAGDEGILISAGTSWSTPIVTATVADVIAGLRVHGESPPPNLIRRGLRNGASSLESHAGSVFSSIGTFDHVCNELGYRFESEEPDFKFDLT